MGVDHPLPGTRGTKPRTPPYRRPIVFLPHMRPRLAAHHGVQIPQQPRNLSPHAYPLPQQATVERMRTKVTAFLSGALGRLQDLNARNMDPELAEFHILDVDRAITPLLIVTENARNPGLNLVPLHMDTAETRRCVRNRRWRAHGTSPNSWRRTTWAVPGPSSTMAPTHGLRIFARMLPARASSWWIRCAREERKRVCRLRR